MIYSACPPFYEKHNNKTKSTATGISRGPEGNAGIFMARECQRA